jgi:hypothetical protein
MHCSHLGKQGGWVVLVSPESSVLTLEVPETVLVLFMAAGSDPRWVMYQSTRLVGQETKQGLSLPGGWEKGH